MEVVVLFIMMVFLMGIFVATIAGILAVVSVVMK